MVESVYSAVRTDSLYKADYVSSLIGKTEGRHSTGHTITASLLSDNLKGTLRNSVGVLSRSRRSTVDHVHPFHRHFANSMACSLIHTGSDFPPFHTVCRPQASDQCDPSCTLRPGEAFSHPRRDWPHQQQGSAVARLPAGWGLLQLTLSSGKCMLRRKIVLGLSIWQVIVVHRLGRSERSWLTMYPAHGRSSPRG
jgi:hypothetical protein